MRVLVCGGRYFKHQAIVDDTLDKLHRQVGIECIIEGGDDGADLCAWKWALGRRVYEERYEADWKGHGKAAGPRRNARMLSESKPDLVVAFPGGNGTADMLRRARKAKVPVVVVQVVVKVSAPKNLKRVFA